MRSRTPANEQVAEVARRRLELLGAELAGIRGDLPDPRTAAPDGPGEPLPAAPAPHRAPSGRHARRSVGLAASLGGWVHDRLPATMQGRVRLGATHLTVLAVLVAAALAVTSWWVVRAAGHGPDMSTAAAVPRPTPVLAAPSPLVAVASPAGAASGAPTGAGTAAADAAASPGSVVVIDVAGKVRHPGIATLPLGARVVDAIRAAGGARRGADLHGLNLARLLVDGEQVVVGVPPPDGVAAPAASAPGAAVPAALVPLNTATQEQLETLPGIGPVTAQAILAWRTDNGAFSAVDELLEVSGIGDATLAQIAPFVTL